MKVLKILGIVFGVLLLLTGGGLLAGSAIVGKGASAFNSELAKQGFAGPVDGTVKSVDSTSPSLVTVTFTDQQGHSQTGQGASSNTVPPKVGDTVPVYYSTSDPTQIVIVDVPGAGSLSKVGSALQTGGIVCLVVGAVLLLAGIVGLVMGKKAPPVAAGQAGAPLAPGSEPYPPNPQGPGYPPQGPPPGYPPQGPPPGYPPQQYPPPGYPQQGPPPGYPPQQGPPPGYPPQGPPQGHSQQGYPQQGYPQQNPPGYPQQNPPQQGPPPQHPPSAR